MPVARAVLSIALILALALGLCTSGTGWAKPQRAGSEESRREAGREASLRELEQRIEDAISRRDHIFLDRVTDPSFVRTDQEGKSEDRASVFAQIRKPPPSADVIRRTITRETQQVRVHGDVGITRSETVVRGPRRAFATTAVRVYRWRSSGWRLLSHHTISTTPLAP